MAFVNASVLLLGSLLVAAPVILHLMMRRRPKQLVFPALRFVKERREQNQRRLRLRQLLLLLLRCAAILALAAALARPSVDSATLGDWLLAATLGVLFLLAAVAATMAYVRGHGRTLVGGLGAVTAVLLAGTVYAAMSALGGGARLDIGDEEAPVAAAVVIDTSARMTYRQDNQTRLEQAKETALWLLPQLPADSEAAVLDSRPGPAAFAVDRAIARRTVEQLEPTAAARRLSDVIVDALGLVDRSDKSRKEVYIFTDLTEAAWKNDDASRLRAVLKEKSDVLLYVFDVGALQPQNVALGALQLSAQQLTPGSQVEVAVEVSTIGPAVPRAVELCLESPDPSLPVIRDGQLVAPEAIPRQRKTIGGDWEDGVHLAPDAASLEGTASSSAEGVAGAGTTTSTATAVRSQIVRFAPLPKLPLGVHHGMVRLEGKDALPLDDVRYFTVEVSRPRPVLIVAPASAEPAFLVEALAPYEFRVTGQARFECQTIAQTSLATTPLEPYSVVCLLDPAPLSNSEWNKLADYARQGGGVALFLGRNAQNYASFNEPAAQSVLPGKIVPPFIWNSPHGDLFLAGANSGHPVMDPFRVLATVTPWRDFPVYKHWVMDASAPESTVAVRYGNNKPALIERPLGSGRVVVLTTPVSDPLNVRGQEPWNLLPTGVDPWPFVILSNELALYLTGNDDSQLNYATRETAVLPNEAPAFPDRYELFPPSGDPREVTAQDGKVTIRFIDAPGTYRLKGSRGGPVLRGFSANLPPEATSLERASVDRLEAALGAERYQLARTRDEFRRKIGLARQGREFYPFLLVVLAIVMGLEYALANRFYSAREA